MLKCCLPWGWPGSRRGVSTGYGYGLRLPDSLVGENEATFLNIGKNHHWSSRWRPRRPVGRLFISPCPYRQGVSVLRGGGGKGSPRCPGDDGNMLT